ncbi:MAG: ABC transporter substrate-binding protein [Desulfobacterales bacterium]|nr:ABC transporter substrate-binding protein [Desulfobacterales bacterium]
MRLLLWVVIIIFYTGTIALAAPSQTKTGLPTVRVGAVFSITGPAAVTNGPSLSGIRRAIDELNLRGGILGHQVELLEFDNRSTPLGSKTAAEAAVAAGVITVFGAAYSSHSLAMAPVLQSARIPMLSPVSTIPRLTRMGNYIFRVCYNDLFQGRVMAAFAIEYMKSKTAGILINADSSFSETLGDRFNKDFTAMGGQVLFIRHYLEKSVDFSDAIRIMGSASPDILILPGHVKDSGTIIKQARQKGINAPFIGGDGWSDLMYEPAGSFLAGSYYTTQWHPNFPGEKSRQFVARYKKNGWFLNPGSALAEDCVFLFADALARAGGFHTEAIRDAIAGTTYFNGVTGQIRFDENGDTVKPAVILKFGTDGSEYIKTVHPD